MRDLIGHFPNTDMIFGPNPHRPSKIKIDPFWFYVDRHNDTITDPIKYAIFTKCKLPVVAPKIRSHHDFGFMILHDLQVFFPSMIQPASLDLSEIPIQHLKVSVLRNSESSRGLLEQSVFEDLVNIPSGQVTSMRDKDRVDQDQHQKRKRIGSYPDQ